mmetsp:Transcript_47000/g.105406  ORF Transcript_47000/g.105406 Transcript_47000/m.105406 type:complete len:104 (-) Transcript_47000:410-721(-)
MKPTSFAIVLESVYRAHTINTTSDRWARQEPASSRSNPSKTPDLRNMYGKERQPAPIADETSVKMAASREPSPSGATTFADKRDKPTDSSSRMHPMPSMVVKL